ncbi:P-loop NTPase fold protein, partial [Micromonospora chalcea]
MVKGSRTNGGSYAVSDAATLDDKLGYRQFADALAGSIADIDDANTPWTVGVYGEWGSGKTSFLMMVRQTLRERHGIEAVWFNAWKYAREEDLWSALMQTILDKAQVDARWPRRLWLKIRIWWRSLSLSQGSWEVLRKVSVLLFRIALIALFLFLVATLLLPSDTDPVKAAAAKTFSGNPTLTNFLQSKPVRGFVALAALLAAKPESLWKLLDTRLGIDLAKFSKRRSYREKISFLDEFTEEFRDVLGIVRQGKPFVVIIDDLDRCLPEQTLQILEAVKLFLDVQGCVFLLAVDREIIENAISAKYKDIKQPDALRQIGETYFEKIVQLPFSLPPPSAESVRRFIEGMSDKPSVRACVEILQGARPYNPRRIKRTQQTFSLLKDLAEESLGAERTVAPLLAKLVIIQAHFRDVYRAAIADRTLLARLELHYRRPSFAAGEDPAPADAEDLVLVEVAKRFSTQYPELSVLLCRQVDETDSFLKVDIDQYLSFVSSVVSEPAVEPEPADAVSGASVRFLISAAEEDSDWVDWIGLQLSEAGYTVSAAVLEPDDAGAAWDDFDYGIALLSAGSGGLRVAHQHWAAAIAAGIRLLVVRVEPGGVPALLATHPVIDLSGLSPTRARTTLLSAIDMPDRVSGDLGSVLVPGMRSVQVGQGARVNIVMPSHRGRVSNLPPAPSELVGRSEVASAIQEVFARRRTVLAPVVCALVGLAGTGKTVLALDYAHRHAKNYDLMWRISLADPTGATRRGVAELASALGVGQSGDEIATLQAIRQELASLDRWLLILDNADDPRIADEYLSLGERGDVIITSRYRSWEHVDRVIQVPVLTPSAAIELLRARSGIEDTSQLTQLAQRLGNLPLALALAGQYLQDTRISPAEYLEGLSTAPERVLASGTVQSVHSTLGRSLDLVRQRNPLAVDLLSARALLAPQTAPRTLLRRVIELWAIGNDLAFDRIAFTEALGVLAQLSLIDLDAEGVSIHPLVQQFARNAVEDQTVQDRWLAVCMQAVLDELPDHPADPVTWQVFSTLVDHVLALADQCEERGVGLRHEVDALDRCGAYLLASGMYTTAAELATRAMVGEEQRFGKDSPNLPRLQDLLGRARLLLGRVTDAMQLQALAWDTKRRQLGDDHPDTLTSANNLAAIYRSAGRLDEAE